MKYWIAETLVSPDNISFPTHETAPGFSSNFIQENTPGFPLCMHSNLTLIYSCFRWRLFYLWWSDRCRQRLFYLWWSDWWRWRLFYPWWSDVNGSCFTFDDLIDVDGGFISQLDIRTGADHCRCNMGDPQGTTDDRAGTHGYDVSTVFKTAFQLL